VRIDARGLVVSVLVCVLCPGLGHRDPMILPKYPNSQ